MCCLTTMFFSMLSPNDKIGKLSLFSMLRFVKLMFSFWSFSNFCFWFVSSVYFTHKRVLCINHLRGIDRIWRRTLWFVWESKEPVAKSMRYYERSKEIIALYCCPIKIGIDMYSFGTAFKQANLTLISKSNPSYVGKSSNCRVFWHVSLLRQGVKRWS